MGVMGAFALMQLAAGLFGLSTSGIVQDAVSSCPQPAQAQWQPLASVPLQTDPQLLFLVLSNLLENACKYSAAETPIELQCSVVNALSAKPMVRRQLSNLPGKAGWPDEAHVFDFARLWLCAPVRHRGALSPGRGSAA